MSHARIIHAHTLLKLARLAVSAAMAGAFLVLLVISTSGQSLGVDGQIAVNTEQIRQLRLDHQDQDAKLAALQLRCEAADTRLTRMEAAGAVCGILLTVLTSLSTITGRRLRTTGGGGD